MGFRGYLIKRTINTIILIVFVIVLNYIIFELMPGTQGVIDAINQNPHLTGEAKTKYIFEEQRRLGLICGGTAANPVSCPAWSKFALFAFVLLAQVH